MDISDCTSFLLDSFEKIPLLSMKALLEIFGVKTNPDNMKEL